MLRSLFLVLVFSPVVFVFQSPYLSRHNPHHKNVPLDEERYAQTSGTLLILVVLSAR